MFAQNLKYLRKSRGIDQAKFADAMGKSVSTISEWESGKYTPKVGVLADIAAFYDVRLDDLMSQDLSQPKQSDDHGTQTTDNSAEKIKMHTYPYMPAQIAAGLPATVDGITNDQLETIAIPDAVMGRWAGNKEICLMHVNGESMNRIIPNGSMIGVQRLDDVRELRNGDIVVFDKDGEYSVKRFFNDQQSKTFSFNPDSTNSEFHPIIYRYEDAESLEIVGKVAVYIVTMD